MQDRAWLSQVAQTVSSSQTRRHCRVARSAGPTHNCMGSGSQTIWAAMQAPSWCLALPCLVPCLALPSWCLAPTLQYAWNVTCPPHEYLTPLISWDLSKHSRGADQGPGGPMQSCDQSQDLWDLEFNHVWSPKLSKFTWN